jgi:hypothetical protein
MSGELMELRDKLDIQLSELECMAEFLMTEVERLDGGNAPSGFFCIEQGAGERPSFCCGDIQRRLRL